MSFRRSPPRPLASASSSCFGGRKKFGNGLFGATPKPGAVGGGRCVGGPATAGPCPWGAARLAAARLRRFEVFGIGVRCCSVSAQRHAVSGSVPKARHRRFRCGRVPSRRTRLLVALERRG